MSIKLRRIDNNRKSDRIKLFRDIEKMIRKKKIQEIKKLVENNPATTQVIRNFETKISKKNGPRRPIMLEPLNNRKSFVKNMKKIPIPKPRRNEFRSY